MIGTAFVAVGLLPTVRIGDDRKDVLPPLTADGIPRWNEKAVDMDVERTQRTTTRREQQLLLALTIMFERMKRRDVETCDGTRNGLEAIH